MIPVRWIFRSFFILALIPGLQAAFAQGPAPEKKPAVAQETVQAKEASGKREKAENSEIPSAPVTHIGGLQTYITDHEDTFLDIARRHNLGFVEMRAANPATDPWMPGAGKKVTLPTMHLIPDASQEGIIINLAEMRLYHFPDNKPPHSYPIGIGRAGLSTPLGKTYVRTKTEGPTWRPTKRMREEDPALPASVPPGPDNPLGTHMIYLGWPEYGIHGTNKPYGIGRRVSSGCIRMYPEGILALYPEVSADDPVTVVDQPLKLAWIEDRLYLEAHLTTNQADTMETEGGLPDYILSDQEMRAIFTALQKRPEPAAGKGRSGKGDISVDWETVRRVIRERRGLPVVIAEREPPDDASGSSSES